MSDSAQRIDMGRYLAGQRRSRRGSTRAGHRQVTACAEALALAVGLLGSTSAARGTNFVVNSLADTLGSGTTVTLRSALMAASSDGGNDIITFDSGLFTSGPQTLKMGGAEFAVGGNVNLVGPGADTLTIDAQGYSRIFNNGSTSQLQISGMTLANGYTNIQNNGNASSGGAIYNAGSVSLNKVRLSNNQALGNYIGNDTQQWGGGAIYNNQGSVTVNNSSLTGNYTDRSGGAIESSGGTVLVQNSTLTGNTVGSYGYGGPDISGNDGAHVTLQNTTATSVKMLYFHTTPPSQLTVTNSQLGGVAGYGTTTVTNSTVSYLSIYEDGTITGSTIGAIVNSDYVHTSHVDISDSTVGSLAQPFGSVTVRNTTFTPGPGTVQAIQVTNGTTLLENVTITGYTSDQDGTVYLADGDNATILNSTIAGNSAARGGGIDVATGTLHMDSTIVANNTASAIGNDLSGIATGSNNLIGDGTGAFMLGSGNLLGVDPLLGPLADNGGPTETMALLPGSQAIDAGSNPDGLLYDQRGVGYPRVVGARADIGAYEVPEPASAALLVVGASALMGRRRRRQVLAR